MGGGLQSYDKHWILLECLNGVLTSDPDLSPWLFVWEVPTLDLWIGYEAQASNEGADLWPLDSYEAQASNGGTEGVVPAVI